MSDIIHIHVFDPATNMLANKSDRAEIHTYHCSRAAECEAHQNGRCILVGRPLGPRCFGGMSVRTGPTRRAKSFGDFVRHGREHEKYDALKSQPNKLFKIGDGYFMPYPHVNLQEGSPFEKKATLLSGGMPYLENPTAEALSKIFTQRPQAMFGGEITSYQKDVVPEIVMHMYADAPELYKKLIGVHPEAAKLVEQFDYTGKRAVLHSLLPGTFTVSNKQWHWDGEYLTGEGGNMLFPPAEADEVRLRPKPDAVVKVTNTEMVGPETEIVD